jgi:hypothetical protein
MVSLQIFGCPLGAKQGLILLLPMLLAGCAYPPAHQTRLEAGFGQTLQSAKDAQRVPRQPDHVPSTQPMATELAAALDNHIAGKAAVGPALKAPISAATQ